MITCMSSRTNSTITTDKWTKSWRVSPPTSAHDKTAVTQEQNNIDKILPELTDWEREVILPLAHKRLEIDLDDGVKQYYPKFGKALAPIPAFDQG